MLYLRSPNVPSLVSALISFRRTVRRSWYFGSPISSSASSGLALPRAATMEGLFARP